MCLPRLRPLQHVVKPHGLQELDFGLQILKSTKCTICKNMLQMYDSVLYPSGHTLQVLQFRIMSVAPYWAVPGKARDIFQLPGLFPHFLHKDVCGEKFIRFSKS